MARVRVLLLEVSAMLKSLAVRGRAMWREIVIAILLGAIALSWLFSCQKKKTGVTPEHQQTADSVRATQGPFDAGQVVSRKTEAAHVATATGYQSSVTRLTASASREHQVADSLARFALSVLGDALAARDSAARAWQAAYESRTQEVAMLKAALDTANQRADAERAARIEADRRDSTTNARLVVVTKSANDLERDANKAANCKIPLTFGLVPCATRRQVAVVSAGVAVAATIIVKGALARKKP